MFGQKRGGARLAGAVLIWFGSICICFAVIRPMFGGRDLLRFPAGVQFGEAVYGSTPKASVLLFNPKAHSVELQAAPACGCTTVSLGQKRLGPFGFTVMKIGFVTSLAPIGTVSKPVFITTTNGTTKGEERLSVVCTSIKS